MSARLRELFTPRAAGSNVFLSCHGYICRVFGASIPVSAFPGEDARSFTAHLPEGQDRGLIAVAVNYQFNGKAVWSGYVLALTRGPDGRAFVDLERPWVPEGAQIIQIDCLGLHLTDAVSGHRFTTDKGIVDQHHAGYVSDGNLLVRCLAGLATMDEVRAAAQAQVEEQSELERLRALVRDRERVVAEEAAEIERELPALRQAAERLTRIEPAARAFHDAVGDVRMRESYTDTLRPLWRALRDALDK